MEQMADCSCGTWEIIKSGSGCRDGGLGCGDSRCCSQPSLDIFSITRIDRIEIESGGTLEITTLIQPSLFSEGDLCKVSGIRTKFTNTPDTNHGEFTGKGIIRDEHDRSGVKWI